MKKIVMSVLGLVSMAAAASPAVVFYPQAQGVQLIYDNVYVGYSGKGEDIHTTSVNSCVQGTCTSDYKEWFDYNIQIGGVLYTDYKIYPFAGLTYSQVKSHEDYYTNDDLWATYDHKHNSVEFEAGALYEFYPNVLAALKFSTTYETVQFGLGYKF